MILAGPAILLAIAQEYRSYSAFPAPEHWVEVGESSTGVRHAVQTGSIAERTDEKEGFTYRKAWLRGEFPEDHGTRIRRTSYYQVYRCDTRQLARTYTLTSYSDDTPMEVSEYDRDEWLWEDFAWLSDHEKAAFEIVCNERM